MCGVMHRAAGAITAALIGLAVCCVSLAGAAPTTVPEVTNLKAKPSRFCAKRTSTCHHAGTKVSFTVSTGARVRADMRPRSRNVGPLVEFVRHFSKGHHTVTMKDSRLTPDRWTLRLQATNTVGSGPITIIDVHVVKHD